MIMIMILNHDYHGSDFNFWNIRLMRNDKWHVRRGPSQSFSLEVWFSNHLNPEILSIDLIWGAGQGGWAVSHTRVREGRSKSLAERRRGIWARSPFESRTSFQAWVRVDAGGQSTAAYILASETVSLAVYANEDDCFALVLDSAGRACTSSPMVSTCNCGPRTLKDKVSRRATDSRSSCTREHVCISVAFICQWGQGRG